MPKVDFDWEHGVPLNEHSKRKHKILHEYFREYLITRCKLPQQEKFRLAVVDGFSGAGRYDDGSPGSPVILFETLQNTLQEINIGRANEGMRQLSIECLFVFNDVNESAIEQLKQNIAPLQAEINDNTPDLYVDVDYHAEAFNDLYPKIKNKLLSWRFGNVLFNLDQGGYSDVDDKIIANVMNTFNSPEVFLTFMIKALLTYLSPDQGKNRALLDNPDLADEIYAFLQNDKEVINKDEWLGKAEKVVFDSLKGCAPFVSPFSIHNPDGWQYWLIHFANSYRARQVWLFSTASLSTDRTVFRIRLM